VALNKPLLDCNTIEPDIVELLKPGRELRVRYHSREKGTEKGETDVARNFQVQSHIEDMRTWVNVEASQPRGGRGGGPFDSVRKQRGPRSRRTLLRRN